MTMTAAVVAFPMHGQHKLSTEGYRTRDGHLIEWFGRHLREVGAVQVVSRPEPAVVVMARSLKATLHRESAPPRIAENTVPKNTYSARLPNLRDRQRWWVDSLRSYRLARIDESVPAVTWNPFLSLSSAWSEVARGRRRIVFDLLDDWTIHYAFQSVSSEVDRAYRRLFARADAVTANALGTVELARKYGRDDVEFIPNGCDPGRFLAESRAEGPLTVGYVGKIGKRLDLELILNAANELPGVRFVFAGPILDAEYRRPLEERENITLLGDVFYEEVPALLQTFDIGWVPHRVGAGEVGGDVIKTYEYRAAALPVLSTPIQGAVERALPGVRVRHGRDHVSFISSLVDNGERVPREPMVIPPDTTWQRKSERILDLAGLPR